MKLCMDDLVDVDGLDTGSRFQRARQGSGIDDLEQVEADDSNIKDCIGNDKDITSPFTGPSKNCPPKVHLPDAIMTCCPALNLSLELSLSHGIVIHNLVLSSPLINTISNAHIPSALGISKINSITSPYYASDNILHIFPPTLLHASLENLLLGDVVYFNA